jgi:hypothetical protein
LVLDGRPDSAGSGVGEDVELETNGSGVAVQEMMDKHTNKK